MDGTLSTLAAPCTHEDSIRKSRFLAQAAPVADTAAALAFIAAVADAAATHNCWAWRIGQDYRFNDDGEPAGTAGRPILQAIDGQRLDGVAVVVTRWFGGIKLGAGGLVRAYGGTAAECLRRAAQVPIIVMARVALECGFAEWPLLQSRLPTWQAVVEQEDYGADGVSLVVALPERHETALQALVANLSRGQHAVRRLD
jgi:uncharacterized YigZ family protein